MKLRPLISKILGPPAVLFLVFVVSNLAYQLIWGAIDGSRRKKLSAAVVEDFHLRMNSGNFSGSCDDEYPIYISNQDCSVELVRLHYGKFKRMKVAQFQAFSEPQWVVVDCVSEFERGELKENFILSGNAEHGLSVSLYQPKIETGQNISE